MTTSTPAQARDVLTQREAESRSARVGNVEYGLQIALGRKAETYTGEALIRFDDGGSGDLFLDHRGKRIEVLEVNGAPVEPEWNGFRLKLPAGELQARNTVRIVYENDYDHGGDGFHQFIDPEDGEEYLYSNFEPYEAHRLFPCFDQPDVKATYSLRVTAPGEWEVVSNSRKAGEAPAGDGLTQHTFETTNRFSTYLFALIAGPYHVVRTPHGDIDLGIYCRKSMVRHLDEDEIFSITKQGLDFYGDFFAYPYPWGKYDQLFVPEFNPGAMENVGAVTFHEQFIFRDPPTDTQRLNRGEVILHEMAHMWFGNLVTKRWWNDLWLNETFATYMAFLALESATRFRGRVWTAFQAEKNWAYRTDELVTTHPIAATVDDTDQAFLNFDGITYGKGAAVIKQLVATIGMDGFREGMRRYFQQYQFSNTTLRQFLGALEQGSGRDLGRWSQLWLETASLNTVAASVETDGERISRLALEQSAQADYPTLRPHTLEVALGREDGGRVAVDVLQADIDGPETEVDAARSRPKPDFVYPNHNDHGYLKVALDAASLAYVEDNIERVEDTLLRQLLWTSLWQMVRDQQLKSTSYLDLVARKITLEPDLELLESILRNVATAVGRYVPDERREAEAHKFVQTAWQALQAAADGDPQIIWARSLIDMAMTPEDLDLIVRLADGAETVAGLTIDQDMRWTVAIKSVAYGLDGAEARVLAERARDESDRGQRAVLRAEVSRSDAAEKATAWGRFMDGSYGSLKLTGAAMSGFNWTAQREILAPYSERFFSEVLGVFETKDKEFSSTYFRNLFPGFRVDQATLERSERALAEAEGNAVLTRMLKEANDDLARAIACREFAAA
jgi:aminopeptidase N